MTTVVGLKWNGEIWLGADCCVVNRDGYIYQAHVEKIYRHGKWLIGLSSAGRILNEFSHLPSHVIGSETIHNFTFSLWGHFEKLEWLLPISEDHPTPWLDLRMVVSDGSGLWRVSGGGSYISMENYTAVGSGAEIAEGALWMAFNWNRQDSLLSPENILLAVLSAAAAHDTGTNTVFNIHRAGSCPDPATGEPMMRKVGAQRPRDA